MVLVPTGISAERYKLEMRFSNPAGKHHDKSLQLQREYGENFLLTRAPNVGQGNSTGTDHSTLLGMHEIQLAARVLDAQVAIVFRELEVLTTVSLQVDVVSKPATIVQQPPPLFQITPPPKPIKSSSEQGLPRAAGSVVLMGYPGWLE